MIRAASVTFILLFGVLIGCGGKSTDSVSNAGATAPQSRKQKGKKKMGKSQELWKAGNEVGQITADGEVWIGGNKVGSIEANGDIWVEGNNEGKLTEKGEVWKAGSKVGEITDKGEVWKEGSEVGTVAKGDVWFGSDRDGSYVGGKPEHAAIFFFYGFFDKFLDE